jgi:hypothetical protein
MVTERQPIAIGPSGTRTAQRTVAPFSYFVTTPSKIATRLVEQSHLTMQTKWGRTLLVE